MITEISSSRELTEYLCCEPLAQSPATATTTVPGAAPPPRQGRVGRHLLRDPGLQTAQNRSLYGSK